MRRPSQFTTVLIFIITALVLPVVTNVASAALPERIKPYVWLAWPAAAVSAVVAAVLDTRRHRASATAPGGGTQADNEHRLRRAVDDLARTVQRQWTAEAGLRMLHRPQPLHLRWASTGRPVSAGASAVLGHDVVGGRPLRLRLRGGSGDIVTAFTRLPRRRLVLLGDPGAGKTVLAILLTLGLLDQRCTHGGPVPVLLSLSSWNPRTEHLHAWVTRRLIEDYPALANEDVFGPAAAARLVTGGHILPVLDGLDEMPVGLHTEAIDGIDRVPPASPVVVTCRSAEYEAAVAAGGMVLSTAAVVELEPVGAQEVITFLSAGRVAGDDRWAPLLARLRERPGGPLAQALSSPLMTALLRTVYTDPAADPAELLDSDRFPDRCAIEGHLLEAFIPAVYSHRLPSPGADGLDAAPLRYPAESARRWLTFLAGHLQQHRTHDLAWWHLHRTFPLVGRRAVGLLLGLVSGLVAGLGVGVGVGLEVGLAAGVAGGFGAGLVAVPPSHPLNASFRLRRGLTSLGRRFVPGLAVGLTMGAGALLAFGAVVRMGATLGGGLETAVKVVCVTGLSAGFTFGAMMWLNTPADALSSPGSRSVLRSDGLVTAIRIVVETLGSGLLAGLATGRYGFSIAVGFTWALAAGLGGGLALGLAGRWAGRFQTGLVGSAWSWFLLTRVWLALRGRLPWRLMRFLDDAHRRGILRQAGAVYQFRHARLQDHLAAQESSAPQSNPIPHLRTPAGSHQPVRASGGQGRVAGDHC
ncbi:NACHT domain-containing protein [Streptomyces sp. NPDC051636]|uniref:NACHT domain-containing protein n=1 Tax=Streptomyces sp. NPDC051636 TaxID=3365663 RepID=UPI0037924DFB